jgi:hypothetical protein
MSLTPVPTKILKCVDKLMDFDHERYATVYDAGKDITYQKFYSQNANISNITVQCNPPDEKVVVSPEIYVRVQYMITFNGTGSGGGSGPLLLPNVTDCPRAYPFNSTTTTLGVQINGTSFNTNLNEWHSTLIRNKTWQDKQDLENSTCPTQPDSFQEFASAQGRNLSPFAEWGAAYSNSRGAYNVVYSANSPTTMTATFWSTERLFLSPFYPCQTGFSGIRTMSLNAVFGDLSRLWCHADPNVNGGNSGYLPGTINSITPQILKFEVLVKFITPKDYMTIPQQLIYPYHEVLPIASLPNTTGTSMAPGVEALFNMTAVNLTAVPNLIYVCVRETDANMFTGTPGSIMSKTDTFAQINNISLQFGNRQGYLSSMELSDLYQMSRRNGYSSSFTDWAFQSGSVLCINPAYDLGLDNLLAPGSLSNPLLSMSVRAKSLKPFTTTSYNLFVFVVYEGSMSINYGSVTKTLALFNSNDVVEASKQTEHMSIVRLNPTNFYGGDFYKTIKDAFGKVKDFFKKHKIVSRVAKKIPHPLAQAVGDTAEQYGYGIRAGAIVSKPPYYNSLETIEGGRKRRRRKVGRKKVGKMSRAQLKRRMGGGNLLEDKKVEFDNNDNLENEDLEFESDSDDCFEEEQ